MLTILMTLNTIIWNKDYNVLILIGKIVIRSKKRYHTFMLQ